MIFYHFTKPESVDAIMREGLLAEKARRHNALTGKNVVWLTENPTMTLSLKQRRLLLKRGILCGPRYSNLPEATVCLKTVIRATDRKLRCLAAWLKKHPVIDPDDLVGADGWWFYAGDLPPSRLEIFKSVPRGTVFWELPVRDELAAGAELVFPWGLEDDLLAARAGPEDYIRENCR